MTRQMETTRQYQGHAAVLLNWAITHMPAWLSTKLDPEDLVQQTLLEAVKANERFEGKADHEVLAYLRRALINNLIDATRKYARSRSDLSQEGSSEPLRGMAEWLAAPDTSPSERFARNERASRLSESLARLPDAQRLAVEMRYLRGAKVAEIALALDRSEGAVAALLHRAVIALKGELGNLEA
ncbi:MAG: RNA polymerase sigma factor [Planctomycetota bacterium]|jgi:RNA polymerase sigma-70 factor (ECF subfamily)